MRKNALLIWVVFAVGLLLLAVEPVTAQQRLATPTNTEKSIPVNPARDPDDTEMVRLEAFRQDLSAYFTEMRDLMQMLADNTFGNAQAFSAVLENLGQIEKVQQSLPQMSATDLYYLHEAFARNPQWQQSPQLIRSVFTPQVVERLKQISEAYQNKKIVKNESGQIVELQSPTCSVPSSGVLNQIGIYVMKGAVLAAEIVQELIPEDSATAPAYITAVAIWGVLSTAELIAEGILEVDSECDDQKFQKRADDFMTDVQPRIWDIQQRVIDIQAQTTEIRKREIEESVDFCRPVISVYLPEPYGRLGDVRDFTQTFITNSLAAATCGTTIPCVLPPLTGQFLVAQNWQTLGVNSMTMPNKEYKLAFLYFCKAYAATVRAAGDY
jgi:hypothetical protein